MDVKEHARRRKRVMEMMDHESIAIIPTSPERQRNRDIVYQFRPDSDFHYLTGFPEPMALAVLVPGREQGEFLMFCRERDAEREQWDGSRAGLEGACDVYGADDAFPIGDVDDILPGLMENRSRVFYAMGYYPEFDQRMLGWVKRLRNKARGGMATPAEFLALDHILHDLRLYKSRGEVKLMRRAAEISARAHRRAMQTCREGLTEYQIEAEITHEFISARADGLRPAAVQTDTHPGFMTDWQSPMVALFTQCDGLSVMYETVYENRFTYVPALNKMGAEIEMYTTPLGSIDSRFVGSTTPCSVVVRGEAGLKGTDVIVPDIRGGFAYVLAAAAADGTTTITGTHHLDRGYNRPIENFAELGLNIRRADVPTPTEA